MRIISSFNPESFGEKMRFRNLIFGKIGRLGLPLIWFTLNPKDIGNIFVVRLAGEGKGMTPAEFQEALDIDSNNIAAQVQMHTHSKTYTKYQKKFSRSRTTANHVPIIQSEGMATDADESPQRLDTQRQLLSHICRFLFPRLLVPESVVTEEGYIRIERNH